MPIATITDWSNGPMGPGFFVFFPANRNIWYDGGPLLEEKKKKPDFERDAEALALMLLVGDQCR